MAQMLVEEDIFRRLVDLYLLAEIQIIHRQSLHSHSISSDLKTSERQMVLENLRTEFQKAESGEAQATALTKLNVWMQQRQRE